MRLLIAGGGTGGHLYPGIAVAEELLSRGPEHAVLFAGSDRGIEARVLPSLGFPFVAVRAAGLVGTGIRGGLRSLATLLLGCIDAFRILRRFRPDACLGVGGYVSFPVVAIARATGVAAGVQEQNAWPGVANRALARIVQRVYTGDPEAAQHFPRAKVRVTGNPLRRAFATPASYELPGPGEALRVLVLGGSQGARALNKAVPEALAWVDFPVEVRHQTGRGKAGEVELRYADRAGVRIEEFIDAMDDAYAWAHLVVARAGALTVAELAAAERPAILVPFPHATGGHQEANARSAERRGAARCLLESDLTGQRLGGMIGELCRAPRQLREMSRAAADSAPRQAAQAIVDDLIGL